jgi:hypothetical protein
MGETEWKKSADQLCPGCRFACVLRLLATHPLAICSDSDSADHSMGATQARPIWPKNPDLDRMR